MSKQLRKYSLVILAAVVAIACAPSGLAQSFHNVPVPSSATGFIGTLTVGGNSAWFPDDNRNIYSYHYGDSGFKLYTQAPAIFGTVAAGGGNAFSQTPDEVWALGVPETGSVFIPYRLTSSGFVAMPGRLWQIAVGPGGRDSCHPYEVWGTNPSNQIFRFDYCSGQFNQQPGSFSYIFVGGAGVWGLNGSQIFQLNFATHTLVQIPNPGGIYQIAVGADGTWGIGSNYQVYEFDSVTQRFVAMAGQYLWGMSAGANGVWGINTSAQIWRLEPSIRGFAQVPGTLNTVPFVGDGGGIWVEANLFSAFATP
jgi:hypothetical protein